MSECRQIDGDDESRRIGVMLHKEDIWLVN